MFERQILTSISELALKLDVQVYLVGGIVRDLLSGLPFCDKDLDLTIEGDAAALARACHQILGGELREFPEFLTAKILNPVGGVATTVCEIDFAATRKESYPAPGSLPVVAAAQIKEDLGRRDFTINAMALKLDDFLYSSADLKAAESKVLDLFGGRGDLRNKTVRVLHAKSFLDDPTRIFRACRYAARLGGEIEPETEARLKEAISCASLQTISRFRVLSELRHIFDERAPGGVIERLLRLGVMQECFPLSKFDGADRLAPFLAVEKIVKEGSGELRYETGLRIIFSFILPERREEVLREYKFGKKYIKRFLKEVSILDGCQPEEPQHVLSDAGVVVALIRGALQGRCGAEWVEEGRRRGIC